MRNDLEGQRLRPLYRGFFIFFAVAGVVAIALSFWEEPRPWKFWISGSTMTIFFGYLGFTGKIPKWLRQGDKR